MRPRLTPTSSSHRSSPPRSRPSSKTPDPRAEATGTAPVQRTPIPTPRQETGGAMKTTGAARRIRVEGRGRIVLPAELRRLLRLQQGDEETAPTPPPPPPPSAGPVFLAHI